MDISEFAVFYIHDGMEKDAGFLSGTIKPIVGRLRGAFSSAFSSGAKRTAEKRVARGLAKSQARASKSSFSAARPHVSQMTSAQISGLRSKRGALRQKLLSQGKLSSKARLNPKIKSKYVAPQTSAFSKVRGFFGAHKRNIGIGAGVAGAGALGYGIGSSGRSRPQYNQGIL